MLLLYALLGLLVGAFLNHCADRLPERRPFLAQPECPYCRAGRFPSEWIALVGYIVHRGKCPRCGAPYTLRAPLLELAAVLLFVFLGRRYGFSLRFVLTALYACIYFLLFVTDIEHRLIPNVVVYPAMVLALAGSLLQPEVVNVKSALIGGALGFGFFYLAALVYPGGMGGGDVKMAGFIGLVTGFPNVITALLIGIFAGGIVSFFLLVVRLRALKDAIPYGPFLAIGGLTVLLFGKDLADWILATYF
ncbi:MAG: prepilin peptidase [Anaerolineae bacterium]